MTVTNYFTEKNYKQIYPFNSTLTLTTLKATKNPMKIFKEKYGLTKTDISKCQIYEVYNSKNVFIYSVNIPKIFKNMKKMKITKNIHIYSNPYGEKTIENMYQDIVSTKFSSLNKRFFFFYENIKINLKENIFLKEYANPSNKDFSKLSKSSSISLPSEISLLLSSSIFLNH